MFRSLFEAATVMNNFSLEVSRMIGFAAKCCLKTVLVKDQSRLTLSSNQLVVKVEFDVLTMRSFFRALDSDQL